MYKGFNLKLDTLFPSPTFYTTGGMDEYAKVLQQGEAVNKANQSIIQTELEKFLRSDNKLDGSSIKNQWFPEVEADVFISHSHKNEKQAIVLAGWLKKYFGLNAFIDSLVWDYAPKLIDKFNQTYNIIGRTPPKGVTYGYTTAKYISSHIDLMLSTALNTMIDHCEALIFLNTPFSTGQAIQGEVLDVKNVEVESPWIYSELETSRIVREKLGRKRLKLFSDSLKKGGVVGMEDLNESKLPPIVYDADIKHLVHLSVDNLIEWKRLYLERSNNINPARETEHPLDTLYGLMKIEN